MRGNFFPPLSELSSINPKLLVNSESTVSRYEIVFSAFFLSRSWQSKKDSLNKETRLVLETNLDRNRTREKQAKKIKHPQKKSN